jgi:hypothetical protein
MPMKREARPESSGRISLTERQVAWSATFAVLLSSSRPSGRNNDRALLGRSDLNVVQRIGITAFG